jgi:membrane-associated phospholipid phosphatase
VLQRFRVDGATADLHGTAGSSPQPGAPPHAAPASNLIPGQWLVSGLALSAVALLLLMWDEHVRVLFAPLPTGIYIITAGLVALLHLRRRDGGHSYPLLREFSGHFVMFIAICLMGTLASYPAAAASHGYVDPKLERIDQALHFDWLSWYRMVSAHPVLQWCGKVAYSSIYATPAVLLGYFAYSGRRSEARLFLVSFWIAAILTLLLFPWLPAKGPLAMLWQGPIPYMPTSALYQAQMIPELRTHVLTQIDLGALRGLVCAPSFHTTAAVIFCFTAWPVRALRWPLLAVNAAMLLSTPVEGTHYLADMLGGALVALASILMTVRVARRVQAKPAPVTATMAYSGAA